MVPVLKAGISAASNARHRVPGNWVLMGSFSPSGRYRRLRNQFSTPSESKQTDNTRK